jgi:hypothetical protein
VIGVQREKNLQALFVFDHFRLTRQDQRNIGLFVHNQVHRRFLIVFFEKAMVVDRHHFVVLERQDRLFLGTLTQNTVDPVRQFLVFGLTAILDATYCRPEKKRGQARQETTGDGPMSQGRTVLALTAQQGLFPTNTPQGFHTGLLKLNATAWRLPDTFEDTWTLVETILAPRGPLIGVRPRLSL